MLALQREQFVDGMDLRELAMSLEIDRLDILALSKLVENSGAQFHPSSRLFLSMLEALKSGLDRTLIRFRRLHLLQTIAEPRPHGMRLRGSLRDGAMLPWLRRHYRRRYGTPYDACTIDRPFQIMHD